jgi:hypothetical protein
MADVAKAAHEAGRIKLAIKVSNVRFILADKPDIVL